MGEILTKNDNKERTISPKEWQKAYDRAHALRGEIDKLLLEKYKNDICKAYDAWMDFLLNLLETIKERTGIDHEKIQKYVTYNAIVLGSIDQEKIPFADLPGEAAIIPRLKKLVEELKTEAQIELITEVNKKLKVALG